MQNVHLHDKLVRHYMAIQDSGGLTVRNGTTTQFGTTASFEKSIIPRSKTEQKFEDYSLFPQLRSRTKVPIGRVSSL